MSADSIIARVEKMQKVLKEDYPKELARKGCEVATDTFAPKHIYPTLNENEYWISGLGAMVAEFGAGQGVVTDGFANDMEFPVYDGSYSDSVQGEYYRSGHDHWTWNGEEFKEYTALRGMYESMKYMRNNFSKVFSEVMNK